MATERPTQHETNHEKCDDPRHSRPAHGCKVIKYL
jgi:hypothetical protein